MDQEIPLNPLPAPVIAVAQPPAPVAPVIAVAQPFMPNLLRERFSMGPKDDQSNNVVFHRNVVNIYRNGVAFLFFLWFSKIWHLSLFCSEFSFKSLMFSLT